MRKCGLYVRVSTDLQTDPEGSLKSQQQRLEEELRHRSRSGEVWQNSGVYIDAGLSGKDTQRPELTRLLADIASGAVDTIICTESSRVSRSLEDFLFILKHLEKHDAKFVSLKEPHFDTSGPVGNFIIRIMASVNQLERETTSERTSNGMQARARRGLWNGGPTPLGYDVIKDRKGFLQVNPDEADVVRLAYATYLKTESIQRTADELNARGYSPKVYQSRRGRVHEARHFHKMSVGGILSNRVYLAEKELNPANQGKEQAKLKESLRYGIVKTEAWPAIIDRETFDRAQVLMKKNGQAHRSAHRQVDHVYLLSGVLRCPSCDCFLEGGYGTSKTGEKNYYYRHATGTKQAECALPSIPADQLEGIVIAKLQDLSLQEDLLQTIVEESGRSILAKQPELQKLLDTRRKELRSIDNESKKLIAVSDVESIKNILQPQLAALSERRGAVQKEITSLELALADLKGNLCSNIDLRNVLSAVKNLFDVLPRVKQKERMSYLLASGELTPGLISFRFWSKSPLLDQARGGVPVGGIRFEQKTEWLPTSTASRTLAPTASCRLTITRGAHGAYAMTAGGWAA